MNKVTDIDLQWYEAVRQDNYPAFEKLFQKYYDPLCRYAQGLLADGSLAEDVVQDMFIHFWENRIKLQVKDSLRAYFYTCIRHRALKNLQKQVAQLAELIQKAEAADRWKSDNYRHSFGRVGEMHLWCGIFPPVLH